MYCTYMVGPGWLNRAATMFRPDFIGSCCVRDSGHITYRSILDVRYSYTIHVGCSYNLNSRTYFAYHITTSPTSLQYQLGMPVGRYLVDSSGLFGVGSYNSTICYDYYVQS